jgi:hypothetical protein
MSNRHLPISGLCLPGVAGIYEWHDETILRFVCEQIGQESCYLAEIAIESGDADTLTNIAELMRVAGAVRRQEPPFAQLWGIASLLKLDTENILNHVCLKLYDVRLALIKKSRQNYRDPRDQIDLAHALILAEEVVQRGSLATDLQEKRPTPVQRWANIVTVKTARRYLSAVTACRAAI